MDSFVTSISRAYLLLMALTGATIVYLATPHEADHYHAAEVELEVLSGMSWDTILRDDRTELLNINSNAYKRILKSSDETLRAVAKEFDRINGQSSIYLGASAQWLPTINHPLRDWRSFIDGVQKVYVDSPSAAMIRRGLQVAMGGEGGTPLCLDAAIGDLQPCSPLIGLPTFDAAYLMPMAVFPSYPDQNARLATPQMKWVLLLGFTEDKRNQRWFGVPVDANLGDHAIVYADNVLCDRLASSPALTGVHRSRLDNLSTLFRWASLWWRRFAPTPLNIGSPARVCDSDLPRNAFFENYFREQSRAWFEVGAMRLFEAQKYWKSKADPSREGLSVAGQSLDERIASYAGSWAFAAVLTFLLCQLTAMRRALSVFRPDRASDLLFPWICFLDTPLAHMVTGLTVLVFPVSSGFLLWAQITDPRAWLLALNLTAVAATFLLGLLCWKQIGGLRKALERAGTRARWSDRVKRRDELMKKRRARMSEAKVSSVKKRVLWSTHAACWKRARRPRRNERA